MSLPWFRLYHRTVDDDKLRLLAFEDRWHFIALCCLKAEGLLDAEMSDVRTRRIAVKLGVQVRELEEIGRRLRDVELVDETLSPIAWDTLQYKSDTSTDRVKKHRENKRKPRAKRSETLQKRSRNALDTDTEADTELAPNGACASGDAPADDFTFDDFFESWNEVATDCGLPTMPKPLPRRRKTFGVRKREYPDIADWRKAFATLRGARWMHGDNKSGWRADADFFLEAKRFSKFVEGSYGQAD